jgi:SAM-dependent methyltransferase
VTEHVQLNRQAWDRLSAEYAESGRRAWASTEPTWGIWQLPEREVRALPSVRGKDVVELGCGTAYWSAWLARQGARVVGLDSSSRQLATARALQREHGLVFPLIQADAEQVPLAGGRFDVVLSEYGASIWCDPYRWIPEAARLLRPGGELVFLKNGTLFTLCAPEGEGVADTRLQRAYFGLHRLQWSDVTSVEFTLEIGQWIRLCRAHDLELLDLLELQAPPDGSTTYPYVTAAWAQRWPSEEIWRLRKR